MHIVVQWLLNHYGEILGTLFSFVYLYFSIKQNIWLWPLGIISSAIYAWVFFNAHIYADMGLQFYYVLISIYGWYQWSYNQTGQKTEILKVRFTGKKLWFYIILLTTILFIIISQILVFYTNSEVPYWDAFTTATGITATWMLAKKYIEHWLIWVLIDLVSSGLYYYKELYFTILLYLVYTAMAIIGYMQWKKDIKLLDKA